MGSVTGKVAIVTGAGRGIGRGIAITYGRAGAKVVVASRTPASVESVVREIKSEGGTALGVTCDVGQREQVFDAVSGAVHEFGTVDILVNNAQAFGPAAKPSSTWILQPLETF